MELSGTNRIEEVGYILTLTLSFLIVINRNDRSLLTVLVENGTEFEEVMEG